MVRLCARSVSGVLSPRLAWVIDLRVHHPHVSRKGIAPREGLVLVAESTLHLDLLVIVDGVLMTGEIVGA